VDVVKVEDGVEVEDGVTGWKLLLRGMWSNWVDGMGVGDVTGLEVRISHLLLSVHRPRCCRLSSSSTTLGTMLCEDRPIVLSYGGGVGTAGKL
jgi:hypothetical protein